MTSPLCVATGGWCRRVFHYRPPTPMYRNSPPLCTIVLQIPSLMPLKMRKVQQRGPRESLPRLLQGPRPHCLSHVQGHLRQPGRVHQDDLRGHPGQQPSRLYRRLEAQPLLHVPRGDHRAARQAQTSWHPTGLHHRERDRRLTPNPPIDGVRTAKGG